MKEFLNWNDIRVGLWNSNPFTWEDVALTEEVLSSGGGIPEVIVPKVNKLSKKKRKKLIRIILTLKGEEYIEEKYKNDIPIITVEDIEFLLLNKSKIVVEVKT